MSRWGRTSSPTAGPGAPAVDPELFATATTRTARVAAAVIDAQLARPTPSQGVTVGALLDHVDGLALAFEHAARKAQPPGEGGAPGDAAHLADGWRQRVPERLAALARAWADPAAWAGTTEAGGLPLSGAAAGAFALDEVVVHGWELAHATGQSYAIDDEVAVVLTGFLTDFLATNGRDPGLFGPQVAVPRQASPADRLLALTGRDPVWHPARR